MENKQNLMSQHAKSARAVVIERLVHHIRLQNLDAADRLLRYFKNHGEHVSREILAAYQHSTHGCLPFFSEMAIHGHRI
jgi:hypothetical protein